jgi:aspartate/tyrosine/aromatic aminotransferase
VASAQSISGTGALRIGFELISQECPAKVLIPAPTWTNHESIAKRAGLAFEYYPYYDPVTKKVKLQDLLAFFDKAQAGTIVLLHACAHNPTGVDPTPEDWKTIAEVMEKKKLIPFFDSAYQGFASGDIIKDIEPVRYFASKGFDMFVSQSYAKNMGLYGLRTGAIHVVTPDKATASKVLSQLKMIIRGNYSSPPLTGARIAEKILNNDALFNEWQA